MHIAVLFVCKGNNDVFLFFKLVLRHQKLPRLDGLTVLDTHGSSDGNATDDDGEAEFTLSQSKSDMQKKVDVVGSDDDSSDGTVRGGQNGGVQCKKFANTR
jgi:hypothetical protein